MFVYGCWYLSYVRKSAIHKEGMMSRYAFLIATGLITTGSLFASDDGPRSNYAESKTFFTVRPQFQVGSPEYLSSVRPACYGRSSRSSHTLSATLFGGQSTNSSKLAHYFMPFGSSQASVNGTVQENGCSLLPDHFSIFSVRYSDLLAMNLPVGVDNVDPAFSSCISVCPKQSVVGVGLAYNGLLRFCNHDILLQLVAPVVHVRNSMRLCESVNEYGQFYDITAPTEDPANLAVQNRSMTQALSQSAWCFGKIDCCTHDTTRLADIQALIGMQWGAHRHCFAQTFIGFTAPTGNDPNACYVFEPIAGNGGHFGLLLQQKTGISLVRNKQDDGIVTLATDITLEYLFSATEKRSFDLRDKPWSRYISLYRCKAQAQQAQDLANANNIAGFFLGTPGINVLTQEVDVRPKFSIAANMALLFGDHTRRRGFGGELGYNFFGKEAERVCLKDCSCFGRPAIRDHSGRGFVNPVRDMTNELLSNEAACLNADVRAKTDAQIIDDYDTRALTVCDLDLASAAHPSTLTHTLYGSVHYACSMGGCPLLFAVGGSYECTGATNAGLHRWLCWGSVGVTF